MAAARNASASNAGDQPTKPAPSATAREPMSCPTNLEPFRSCLKSRKPMPLFVPAALVEESRQRWPRMWIEEMPQLPLNGSAITHDEWARVLQQSSEDSSKSAGT